MKASQTISTELRLLFTFRKNTRKWHLALLAAICVGTPLLLGIYFNNLQQALLASLSALVILYLPGSGSKTHRILTLLICSFGFMVSFSFGLIFSFHPLVAIFSFGIFSFLAHWVALYYKASPPRSFFFIMVASMAICMPFDLSSIPIKIGMVSLGTIFSCMLGLIYIFLFPSTQTNKSESEAANKDFRKYADYWEAIITGCFMCVALALGHLMKLDNPYWIPISCAAVMQGASLYHIWQRSFYRITGTFIGLGLCWFILGIVESPFSIAITIIILQFIIEILVVRHYAWAVVFITPLTILLSEAAHPLFHNPDELITLRFTEICIGSILGAFGGWTLHKEKLRFHSIKGLALIGNKMKKNRS